MTINLIAAISMTNQLGYKNQLLCDLPADMAHFKKLTTGNIVLFGRKTYESIGHPLSERTNIVLTRDEKYDPHPALYMYSSVEDVLHEYHNYGDGEAELFICGGQEIYEQFLPYADKIYLTIIDHKFEEADCMFPQINNNVWKIHSVKRNKKNIDNAYDTTYITYYRR